MDLVTIKNGRYSTGKDSFRDIENVQFPVVNATIETNDKGKYIEVDGTPVRGYPKRAFKVFVAGKSAFELSTGKLQAQPAKPRSGVRAPTQIAQAAFLVANSVGVSTEYFESDDKIKERISERFDVMDEMIQSAAEGEVRGIVVTGPPGVGKSFGVAKALRNSIELPQLQAILEYDSESDQPKPPPVNKEQNEKDMIERFRFVSGHCTPLKLFEILYEGREENMVTTFDDCDGVLRNEDALNLFKVALDTTAEKRILTWNSTRERADVPNRFEFKGSVIVITNINFEAPEKASAAMHEHLAAIMSRVYYIDLAINDLRDKYLHIEGVCKDHDLLKHQGLAPRQVQEVMDFFKANLSNFREVSIRTVQKIGKLCLKHENWVRVAIITTFKSIAIISYDRTIDIKAIEAESSAKEVVALFDKHASYDGTVQSMAEKQASDDAANA